MSTHFVQRLHRKYKCVHVCIYFNDILFIHLAIALTRLCIFGCGYVDTHTHTIQLSICSSSSKTRQFDKNLNLSFIFNLKWIVKKVQYLQQCNLFKRLRKYVLNLCTPLCIQILRQFSSLHRIFNADSELLKFHYFYYAGCMSKQADRQAINSNLLNTRMDRKENLISLLMQIKHFKEARHTRIRHNLLQSEKKPAATDTHT